METLHSIFQAEIIQRFGWTLVHFVWQATAIGLILAIVLKLLHKSSANLRYIIACMALALIVLMPAVTIRMIDASAETIEPVQQISVDLPRAGADAQTVVEIPQLTSQPAQVAVTPPIPLKDRCIGAVKPALPYAVVVWLVGVFALSLWHLGGWAQLQRLRRQMVKKVTPALKAKLQQLSNALGIRETVDLVESALVQVPTVVGHLKPIILLPASALTGLSPEQIEAILAHELAHIKRHDYLVNMLQTVVEVLGFYHPAVWWVSHKIKVERENCCDDLAVSISGDRVAYVKALTSMEEVRTSQLGLAIAASGGSLFDRIRRLLGKDPANEGRINWLPSVIAVLIGALLIPTALALSNGKNDPKTQTRESYIPSNSTIDEDGRIVDKLDYHFINDSQITGTWKSVDFVGEIQQFKVGEKQWEGRGGDLYLKELIFLPQGRTFKPWWTWTKGLVFHSGDKTASRYTLKDIEGSTYMFFEWKSGDYTIRHRKPLYYVLKKVSSKTGGLAEAWTSQPSDTEFAGQLPAKIEQLDIDSAGLEDVKEIFGEPAQYIWGSETFTEDDLPKQYILVDLNRIHVYMCEDQIVELRHESGSNYVLRGKLRSGSTLDEVFEVIGPPDKTVKGKKNSFKDGVLYKDINGRKGHCYYARSDQDLRLWFLDYKIIAIYMTRSDYGQERTPKKVRSETNTIVPGQRVGDYTFDMTKDDVLEELGKPNVIFYGGQRYTLDNLPKTYYMHFGDVSFRILDDSVKEIAPISPFYKFANGLGVGSTEQEIKQAFGNDFHLKKTENKDFLAYDDKGLVFEIDKHDRTVMEISVLPIEPLVSQPGDAEFAKQLPAKIEQLDIDTADLAQVKKIFGKPAQYIWGDETFAEDDLPRRYILIYPGRFHIFMNEDQIVELRHESGSDCVFRGKLRSGSSLTDMFEVIGPPDRTVQGEKNSFEDGVLYKDIAGKKGHCYYARSEQNVRLWFMDYKVIAIYMTCSDYKAWAAPRYGLLGLQLNNKRWPLVDIVPGMPAAEAGLQNGDRILKVDGKDITHITTIRGALTVLHGDPGQKVKLTVQRGEQILDFEVERTKAQKKKSDNEPQNEQQQKTAKILRIECDEDVEDGDDDEAVRNTVSLGIPLASLKAGKIVLPKAAEHQMERYGITIEEIIKMMEEGVEPMILLDIEETVQDKSEEIYTHVKISLE